MKYEHICQDLVDRINELEEKVERYEKALKEIANHIVIDDDSDLDFIELTSLEASGYTYLKKIAKKSISE